MLFLAVLIAATLLSAGAAAIGQFRWEGWAPSMRLGLVVGLFIFGVDHLITPERYVAMIEGFLPEPYFLAVFTGLCEIAGAIGLLLPATRRLAGLALAAYFVAVFPANIANALGGLDVEGLPQSEWYYWVRLAIQPVFVWWALVAGGTISLPGRKAAAH